VETRETHHFSLSAFLGFGGFASAVFGARKSFCIVSSKFFRASEPS
jgi:hypothetical protein